MSMRASVEQMVTANPIPARLIGLTPILAASDTLARAAAMAAALTVVLVFAAIACSVTRRLVPSSNRLLFDLVNIATIVSLLGIALQRYALPVHEALGVYLPVLAASALVWTVAEEALHRPLASAVAGALRFAAAAALVLLALAGPRHLLGYGWQPVGLLADVAPLWPLPPHPCGGLLLLGLLLAAVNRWGRVAADAEQAAGGA